MQLMPISLQELASRIDGRIWGRSNVELADVAPLDAAGPDHLAYVDSRKSLPALKTTRAGAVLITETLAATIPDAERPIPLVFVEDPQAAFIAAMLLFRPQRPRAVTGISPQALVSPSATLGPECNVSPHAQIGDDVVLGARCDIGPGAIIGEGCVIGEDCIVHANSVLYPRVTLQDRVTVHAHAVIGADGFGYRFVDGTLQKIPHTGTVLIEEDVEIGAGATIDRAMMGTTVIGRGTKLDNQVQIAHNCRVGRHNAFASQVGLAGSVTTGDYVQCGGQVGVADHCTIVGGVKFGGQAGIMGDITEPGNYHGSPALPEKEAIKNYLNTLKVAEIRDQIKALTAQLARLEQQLQEQQGPQQSVHSQQSAA
jgi:UDP-3-O-[3-hydroxymyristoyl] glucosamine N-acyltransferase